MRYVRLFALCLATLPFVASAAMQSRTLEWRVGETTFEGVLVYDDAGPQRPGIVMVPNWMGVTDDAVAQARRIAGDRYVVLVADVYGKGVRPADAGEARAQTTRMYADPAELRRRAAAAVEALRGAPDLPLDAGRVAGMGFCFGGTTVLELARADLGGLAGVVSLHGGLTSRLPAQGRVRTPILVLNGAADSAVGAEDIAAFQAEMDAVGADWQFVNFAGARHCFAEPTATGEANPNCVYDPRAAGRARAMVEVFLDEVL